MQNLPPWLNHAYLLLYIMSYMFDDSLMVAVVVITLGKHRLQEEGGRMLQLGRKYVGARGLMVPNEQGKVVTVTMGSYGVGVSRAVAAVAETHADERGLVWPRELAPFDVQILATGKDSAVVEFAEKLAMELSAAGIDVLLDDRKASPGVKFTDAEILGVPTAVVVGRGLADGLIEVRDRASGERSELSVHGATEALVALLLS